MTEIADDRSWWADVEHLRPGADPPAAPLRSAPSAVAERRRRTETPSAPDEKVPARRGRITGRALPEDDPARDAPPAVLRRADAADFAAAMDLDGAFGAPASRAQSREIVLSGRRRADSRPVARTFDDETDPRHAAPRRGSRPAAQGDDRPTVRISGHPGGHQEIAERRALREVEARRPRSAVERAEHRPDRIAMYAVLLGVFLVLVAALSSGGVS